MPDRSNNMNKELKDAIEMYDSYSAFEKSYGYYNFFLDQMKNAKTEAERKAVWDAVILVNSKGVRELSEQAVMEMMGYKDEDMIEDLYQEGMLILTQKVNRIKKAYPKGSCSPVNLMFGMIVDLMEKLVEIRGPFRTVSIYDFIEE